MAHIGAIKTIVLDFSVVIPTFVEYKEVKSIVRLMIKSIKARFLMVDGDKGPFCDRLDERIPRMRRGSGLLYLGDIEIRDPVMYDYDPVWYCGVVG